MESNEEVNGTENGTEDGLQKYCLALLWRGLNDRARLKAVRTGNGEKMIMYWRLDMVEFFSKKRTKYFMLGHRLLAGINGWLPARLQNDLMWNRTVNYTGEVDRNLEIDFFNEYLNKEFVENLKRGGISFDEDVVKQNAMAWRMKRHLNKIFNPEVGHDYFSKIEGSKDNEEIVYEMLREYSKDELFTEKKGRTVNGLNTISLKMKVKYPNLGDRLRNLSWDLDAERKKALSMIRIPHE